MSGIVNTAIANTHLPTSRRDRSGESRSNPKTTAREKWLQFMLRLMSMVIQRR
ncbi:hypothetical protein ACQ4M4_17795 [Leptolyngbya sp. AN02str]|uniref:hypothetical protein n=1 Tax=Leptolyngbya sp. AN02str TaxID=3423363 RepID=UPI003D3140F3